MLKETQILRPQCISSLITREYIEGQWAHAHETHWCNTTACENSLTKMVECLVKAQSGCSWGKRTEDLKTGVLPYRVAFCFELVADIQGRLHNQNSLNQEVIVEVRVALTYYYS